MITDILINAERYTALHPRFAAAFEFLRRSDLDTLSTGRHVIDGDKLFVLIQRSNGRTRDEARLESHRRYIDIQYVIAGHEEMGWRPTADCNDIVTPYGAEKDIAFYADTPETWVATPAGSFCIFFPEDAHAPLVGDGEIHKAVIKVAVQ